MPLTRDLMLGVNNKKSVRMPAKISTKLSMWKSLQMSVRAFVILASKVWGFIRGKTFGDSKASMDVW